MAETLGEAYVRVHADTSLMGNEIERAANKMNAQAIGSRFGEKFAKGVQTSIRTRLDSAFKEGFVTGNFEPFIKQFASVDKALDNATERLDRMRTHGNMARDDFTDLSFAVHAAFDARAINQAEEHAKSIEKNRKAMRGLRGILNNLPDVMGRAFGKGSRNDFLNLTGSIVGGLAGIGTGIGKLILGIPDAFRAVQTMFQNVGSGIKGFFDDFASGAGVIGKLQAAFGSSENGAASLIGSIGALLGPIGSLIVAGGVLAVVMSTVGFAVLALGEAFAVLTSFASLAVGGVVAVSGAIGVALVGALAAAAPLALALAAGFGTVVVAFKNMSDKTKAQFKPLGDQFDKLGSHIADVFFRDAPKWVNGLSSLMKTFAGPTMEGVAKGVRDAFSGMLKDFQNPAMTNALKAISDALGPLAGTLATALGKVFQGITAFMVPLLPLAQQLANAIGAVAFQFAAWAQSAEGQSSISSFFTKAWGLAKDLWGILLNVGDALGTVLMTGSDSAGAGFLGWLKEKTEDLKKFLKTPEGQNQLQTWFDNAKTLGTELWGTLEKVGGTLKALDTPANREFATKLVADIGNIIKFLGDMGPAFEATGKAIEAMAIAAAPALSILLVTISGIAHALGLLLGAWGKLPGQEWATEASHAMEEVEAAAWKAGQAVINGIPKEVNVEFDGDASHLQEATIDGTKYIATVDKEHNTNFLGSAAGVEAAAAAANTGIVGVPPDHNTDFLGKLDALQRSADESRGAIAGVETAWWTDFYGKDGGINRAAADARQNINTVPSVYTTTFTGDISGILAKIAIARQQISGLMAQSDGLALGNADLGQRAAGGIVGMAAGSILKGPRVILAGEAGPEAIVPLRRDLSRVDPSVRGLSAFAQGKSGMGIEAGAIQVTLTNSDPQQVASALLDRMVAVLH